MAMPRKMFAAIGNAGLQQTMHEALCKQGDDAGVTVERTIADHLRPAPIQVQDWRKAEINAAGTKLGPENIAARSGGIGRPHRIFHPKLAKSPHRRQMGESIGAKSLDTSALVIHTNQQVRTNGFDIGAKRTDLIPTLPVSAKKDDPSGQGVRKPTSIGRIKVQPFNVQNHWGVLSHWLSFLSTTTKLAA